MSNMTAELLAPAGSPEALDAAIAEGADAVYLGLKNFNARMRSANFAYSQFEAATESIHKLGKKIYVTVNTVFEQREADRIYQLLQYLERVGPDGIIVQDLGVVKMARDHFPRLKLHASTQMNVASAAGSNFLSRYGFKRVVLSRELSLDELKAIRAATNMELETFVHGALCVSASGLCLFSSYLGGRSANRGACTQACRRLFRSEGDDDGYYFSPDDLQLVERIPELVEAGVSSLKIEGRMKSADYVGSVVAAYRHMLDNWRFDRERAASKALSMLQGDFARRKTSFWFDGTPEPGSFLRPEQAGGTGIAMGKVKLVRVFDEKRWMQIGRYDGLAEGDSLRIHKHDDSGRATAKVRGVKDLAEGFFVRVDEEFGPQDEVYLVQTKSLSKRYRPILPSSLARYHKFPSYDAAPAPGVPELPKDGLLPWPEGNYALVSRVQDLHVLQSDRPKKAMLRLTRKNAELMRRHEKELPFRADELVIWLEPYFPQADAEWLAEELAYWTERGQKLFVANNLGHLSLLKSKGLSIITGPWLYAFNAWAAALLLENGAAAIMPPLEISKQDFQKLADYVPAAALFPTVFAYPQLFTVRSDLGRYGFRFFADRDGGEYELVSDQTGSVVIPIEPFSLVDRIPYLKKDGVGRFALDFSFIDLKKQIYKRVMAAARDGIVLPNTGRFNWKEGFWQPDEAGPGAKPYGNADSGRRAAGPRAEGSTAKAGSDASASRGGEAARKARYDAAVERAKKAAGRPGRGGRPQWYEKEGAGAAEGTKGRAPARRGAPRPEAGATRRSGPARPIDQGGGPASRPGGRPASRPSSGPAKPRGPRPEAPPRGRR